MLHFVQNISIQNNGITLQFIDSMRQTDTKKGQELMGAQYGPPLP